MKHVALTSVAKAHAPVIVIMVTVIHAKDTQSHLLAHTCSYTHKSQFMEGYHPRMQNKQRYQRYLNEPLECPR